MWPISFHLYHHRPNYSPEELIGVGGAGEWLEEIERVGTESKVTLLGKGAERMGNEVMLEVGRYIMCWLVKCWQRRKGLMHGFSTHTRKGLMHGLPTHTATSYIYTYHQVALFILSFIILYCNCCMVLNRHSSLKMTFLLTLLCGAI